jgi:superfamily I DNA/RNA helicase
MVKSKNNLLKLSERDKLNDKIIKTTDGQTFIPSKYQSSIFYEIEHTSNNVVIEACAGAAKTTTCVKIMGMLPESKKILFAAFNVDIVKDIKRKVGESKNIDICTLHSLGYRILRNHFKEKEMAIDEYKYISYIQNNIEELTEYDFTSEQKSEKRRFIDNVLKLVNFGRFNLCQSINELHKICKTYSIDCIYDECNAAIKVMDWGINHKEAIDYTDMIWIPIEGDINTYIKYDYVCIDEAQDVNLCEFKLIQKVFKMGTRFIASGDAFQSIYSFSGSLPNIMDMFKEMPNTVSLPLSISYRCPKSIIRFVKNKFNYIPIEANKDAIEGVIRYDSHISDLKSGDSVLCRNNAPLTKVYMDLLKLGKETNIIGKDIGQNLINTIDDYHCGSINIDMHNDGLIRRLYLNLFNEIENISKKYNIDEKTASNSQQSIMLYDTICTIETLSDGLNKCDDLKERINKIFSDEEGNSDIYLSTIHKSKGLTLNNVYVCCPSLIPGKQAKQDWEKSQERNLEYVCYTRAKNSLSFMSEDGFGKYLNGGSEDIYKKIKGKKDYIEKIIGITNIEKSDDSIHKRKIVLEKRNNDNLLIERHNKDKEHILSEIKEENKISVLKRKNKKIKL